MATLAKAISKTTGATISSYTSAADGARGKLTIACDSLIADGHTDLLAYRAPDKGEDRTFYDSLVAYVVKGYTAKAQALLAMDTKELTAEQKAEKRSYGMDKGRDVANIRNAMTKRLQREESKGAVTPKSEEAAMIEKLATVAKKAQGKEGAPYDTVLVVKHINLAIKEIAKAK